MPIESPDTQRPRFSCTSSLLKASALPIFTFTTSFWLSKTTLQVCVYALKTAPMSQTTPISSYPFTDTPTFEDLMLVLDIMHVANCCPPQRGDLSYYEYLQGTPPTLDELHRCNGHFKPFGFGRLHCSARRIYNMARSEADEMSETTTPHANGGIGMMLKLCRVFWRPRPSHMRQRVVHDQRLLGPSAATTMTPRSLLSHFKLLCKLGRISEAFLVLGHHSYTPGRSSSSDTIK